jgi:hypothetical protein
MRLLQKQRRCGGYRKIGEVTATGYRGAAIEFSAKTRLTLAEEAAAPEP